MEASVLDSYLYIYDEKKILPTYFFAWSSINFFIWLSVFFPVKVKKDSLCIISYSKEETKKICAPRIRMEASVLDSYLYIYDEKNILPTYFFAWSSIYFFIWLSVFFPLR